MNKDTLVPASARDLAIVPHLGGVNLVESFLETTCSQTVSVLHWEEIWNQQHVFMRVVNAHPENRLFIQPGHVVPPRHMVFVEVCIDLAEVALDEDFGLVSGVTFTGWESPKSLDLLRLCSLIAPDELIRYTCRWRQEQVLAMPRLPLSSECHLSMLGEPRAVVDKDQDVSETPGPQQQQQKQQQQQQQQQKH